MSTTHPRHIASIGMFDGLHAGHRFLLRQLRSEANARGLTPLAITFPTHPLHIIAPERAPMLLSTTSEKEALLHAAGVTPLMLPFDNELRNTSASRFLTLLHTRHQVDALLLGFNNRFGHDAPSGFHSYRQLAEQAGIELIQANELPTGSAPTVSSSLIRGFLASGSIDQANTLLGRPYSVNGTVVHGRRLGHTIGFPTANLQPGSPLKLIPSEGVYAAMALLPGGERHPAVVNIGHRPTVESTSDAPLSIEAHIIGFTGNLYGQPLTLEFMARIRSEQRFDSIDTLRKAIEADRAAALSLLDSHHNSHR